MTVTVFILFVIILTGWFSVTDLPVALAPAGNLPHCGQTVPCPGDYASALYRNQPFPSAGSSACPRQGLRCGDLRRDLGGSGRQDIHKGRFHSVFSCRSDSWDADAPKRFVGDPVVGAAFVAGRGHIHNPYRHHSLQGNLCDFVKV